MQDARRLASLVIRLDRISHIVKEHTEELNAISRIVELLQLQEQALKESIDDVREFLLERK